MSGTTPENKAPSQQHNEKFQKQFDTYLRNPSTLKEKLNDTSLNKALEEQLKDRNFAIKMLYDVDKAINKKGLNPEDKQSLETVKSMIEGKYASMTDVENYKRTLKSQQPTGGEVPPKTTDAETKNKENTPNVETFNNKLSTLDKVTVKLYSGIKMDDYKKLFAEAAKGTDVQIKLANEYMDAIIKEDLTFKGANTDKMPGIKTFEVICKALGQPSVYETVSKRIAAENPVNPVKAPKPSTINTPPKSNQPEVVPTGNDRFIKKISDISQRNIFADNKYRYFITIDTDQKKGNSTLILNADGTYTINIKGIYGNGTWRKDGDNLQITDAKGDIHTIKSIDDLRNKINPTSKIDLSNISPTIDLPNKSSVKESTSTRGYTPNIDLNNLIPKQ